MLLSKRKGQKGREGGTLPKQEGGGTRTRIMKEKERGKEMKIVEDKL